MCQVFFVPQVTACAYYGLSLGDKWRDYSSTNRKGNRLGNLEEGINMNGLVYGGIRSCCCRRIICCPRPVVPVVVRTSRGSGVGIIAIAILILLALAVIF